MVVLKSILAAAAAFVPFAAAANTLITVGAGGQLKFVPNNINASAGDVITFQWAGSPGNHSVTQSSFAAPCTPLTGGFDSGFVFTPAGITTGFAEWNLTITNASAPIWFFCKQFGTSDHCKAGMVGAFNAPASGPKTFANFVTAAAATNSSGQAIGGLVGVGASASAVPGPLTGSITAYGAPTATAPGAGATSTSTQKPTGAGSSVSANILTVFLGSAMALIFA